MSHPGNSPPPTGMYYQGDTSGVRPENSSLHPLIESFQRKIGEFEGKREIPYTRPTIVSRKNTLTESVQSYQKPRLLSIGPLHRGDANLQPMEDFKWSFVCILKNSTVEKFNTTLSDCFVKLKGSEEKCRRTYSVFIDMTSDDFVQMLFLDACFIVLLTLAALNAKKGSSLSTEQNDLLSHPKIMEILEILQPLNVRELDEDVTTDMIILENQIPFSVYEDMWKFFIKIVLDIQSQLDFIGCHHFLQRERINNTDNIHHFLHLYHCSFVPAPSPNPKSCDRYNRPWIPSATELKESGIHFKLEERAPLNADITFSTADGVVHTPEKNLDEDLRAVIQNLVDFEQSVRGDCTTYYSNYVWIMSRLLSTEDDVRILQEGYKKKGRLLPTEGGVRTLQEGYEMGWDKDVQRFFNDLERRCSYWKVDDEIQTMCNEIDAYRLSRLTELMTKLNASIKRKFCSSLWVTPSIAGAVVLFILTFLQTFFAMYSYSHPPS